MNVVMPGDKKLNCDQLKEGYAETRRFKKEAETVRETDTGANVLFIAHPNTTSLVLLRLLLFSFF